MITRLLIPTDPLWHDATALMARTYYRAYGAELKTFSTRIMATVGAEGRILCAAGLRTDAEGFFSDIYVDRGCAQAIAATVGEPVADNELIEVVNMASQSQCAALPLLDAITRSGREMGKRWGVFTATTHLRRLLKRAGLPLIELAPAHAERCDDPAMWGSYYAAAPWVCALRDTASARLAFSPRLLVLSRQEPHLRAG